jgi:uncharacterized protein YggE
VTTSFHLSRLVFCLAGSSLFLLASLPSFATDFPLRKVTTVGAATVKVAPDEMRWSVQISIDDSTLAKAKARHDSSLTDALKFIKSFGSASKDLQTGGISIQRNDYAQTGNPAVARVFICTTQFTFTLTDFDKYGPICDGLAKLDGVQVQSVDYAYSKEEDAQRDALKKALLKAHDKASDLAATANCYVDKPLEILEGTAENGPRPLFAPRVISMTAAAPGTPPAVAGQIEISATVTATYELYYK